MAAVAAGTLLGACGDEPTVTAPGQAGTTTTPPTTVAASPATATMDLTTTDGYRYKVTMEFGPPSATGAADCPGTPAAGKVFFPLTVTVANAAPDRPAPFPPLRVEMTAAPGTKPAPVQVKDAAGPCTSTPRQPSIAAGQSAVFKGNTPAVDAGAAKGSAGQIDVRVSETTFDLSVPLP